MTDFDATKVPAAAVDEILRQGEACLAGTVQLALAADQRGGTMTGILGAGAVALLAAAAAIPNTGNGLTVPFVATAALLFVAALLVAWSARPIDFHVGGYEPRLLCESGTDDPVWLKRFAIADVQMRIDANRQALAAASRWFNAGLCIAGLAPVAGVAAYLAGL